MELRKFHISQTCPGQGSMGDAHPFVAQRDSGVAIEPATAPSGENAALCGDKSAGHPHPTQ
ncbi:hypothetical protein AA15669_0518 [Saccharibacter floricola DSM 15669]|uniref:Uncharacterized protein n=1 Tax=Saccharibacter floricola DSM 15669 TaxID=1123227 RepID=A0ABQ0NXL4_9PROT|nr:hypothetical protein AA15669_0518 [Saccharibacter floricola DSM 15669]